MDNVILFLTAVLFYCGWLIWRNKMVYKFRIHVLKLIEEKSNIESKNGNWKYGNIEKYYGKLPSYDKMLFSFKSLKLKLYFTKKEISELKNSK